MWVEGLPFAEIVRKADGGMEMLSSREGKKRKRWLALLLAGAMVLSGMGTPSAVVRAEEATVEQIQETKSATVSGNETEQTADEQLAEAQDDTQGAPEEAQIAVLSEEAAVSKQDAVGNAEQYVLDATDLAQFTNGAKKDGEEQSAGTDDYFTILWSSKSKVDGSNKSFDDGTTLTQRINLGEKLDVAKKKNGGKFTTVGAAEVKVYWVEGGDDNRQMALLNGSGTVAAKTEETLAKNAACISVLKVTEAGTYYLGGLENNNYIFKVIVTETTGSTEKPARADWSTVESPEIISAVQNAGKMDVTVKTNIGYDGADKIEVTMSDAEGNVIGTAKSSKEGNESEVSFTPAASGT